MASSLEPSAGALPALTGLRGVAALWIVLYHIQSGTQMLGLPSWLRTGLLAHGWIAVDIFFILSGFVLMHAHGRDFTTIRAEHVRRFALQRFFRVYPTSAAVLLLIVGLASLDPAFVAYRQALNPAHFTLKPFFATLTLTRGWVPVAGDWNAPIWSLSVEIAGYAAFPWLARALSGIKRLLPALAAGIACIAVLVWCDHISGRTDYNDIGAWAFVRMAFGFTGGACLAKFRSLATHHVSAASGAMAALGTVGLICACAVPGLMILALPASAALVLALALGGGSIGTVLSSVPALWLGRISFPLYLAHLTPLLWLAYHNQAARLSGVASWAMIGTYLILCLLLADRLHRLVEKPSQRLARRLSRALPPADRGLPAALA